MAARSNKIFREILFKHYRYNSKIVSPIFSNVTRTFSQNVTKKKVTSLKLAHAQLDKDFVNISHLQPALLPAFSTSHKITQIKRPFEQTNTNDVFPKRNITDSLFNNLTRTDMLTAQSRHFSTMQSSIRHYSNKKWGNQTEGEECPPPKKDCYKPCPKWQMHNCPPQGDNLNCAKAYVDPCCKKKLAPYPSYSELCAERLEDDPSECMQCPWKRCGGSESLKYPKRKYHTGTHAAFNRFSAPALPPENVLEYTVPITCDAKKPPCKRPPGKCDKVQTTDPCPEEKKGPCPPPFERKKCDKEKKAIDRWSEVYRMWTDKNNIVPMTENLNNVIIPREEQAPAVEIWTKKGNDCDYDRITPDNSCCLKNRMELAKEHDKGHPPPCPNWRKPSKQCPKPEKCKRPYRQQHDLNEPFYRRQKKPWAEIDKGHGDPKPDLYS